ncbi:glycosyltransferase, partial [Salinimicrobium oceani]
LLEAMSMECAIVSTRAGGVVEVVRDKRDGLLCEVGDYKCLAEKSLELIGDAKMRQKKQLSARERVVSSFSLKRMVDELEVIYSEHVKK